MANTQEMVEQIARENQAIEITTNKLIKEEK
jgi:hypothetical protein